MHASVAPPPPRVDAATIPAVAPCQPPDGLFLTFLQRPARSPSAFPSSPPQTPMHGGLGRPASRFRGACKPPFIVRKRGRSSRSVEVYFLSHYKHSQSSSSACAPSQDRRCSCAWLTALSLTPPSRHQLVTRRCIYHQQHSISSLVQLQLLAGSALLSPWLCKRTRPSQTCNRFN